MCHVHEPRTLPEILSVEEVTKILQSAGNLKYQAALSVGYRAGLRANDITHLKVTDVDSERMILRVEQGKGGRDSDESDFSTCVNSRNFLRLSAACRPRWAVT